MKNKLPPNLASFIFYFLKSYKKVACAYIFLGLIAGFWGPINSILIKRTIDLLPNLNSEGYSSLITLASLLVINFIIFDNITWRSITFIRARYIPVIIHKISVALVESTHKKSFQYFQNNLSGRITKQITTLTDNIERILANNAAQFLRGGSLLIIALITSFTVNPIFSIIMIIWIILFLALSLKMSKKYIALSNDYAIADSTVTGELVDSIANHSNVRLFARGVFETSRLSLFFRKKSQLYSRAYYYNLKMASIQGGLIALMMAFSCVFLIKLYQKNLVTIGDFALILGLAMEVGHITWFTMSVVDEFNESVGRCKQSMFLLIKPLEVVDCKDAKPLKCKKGNIKFEKVKFHYRGSTPLFENKNVEIKAGEKVGLVGFSGSGKTTFASLILRFHDINEGRILIDNQDISKCPQDSLRENITMIPQDPSLFNRSLMENIRYGNLEATAEEVIHAAKKAHAHEFITQLPEGYDSLVGERGVKLSGGQRQRIAIARAMLENAPILILDEATSQLDSVTEKLIQESIHELMKNKTTIIIAHRLSTLRDMDRVLVFDSGNIVQDGSHHQLIRQEGLYKTLWDSQIDGMIPDIKNQQIS